MIYYYRYLFVKMKVFNYSELHFAKVTFYKIHTLGGTTFDNGFIFKNIRIEIEKRKKNPEGGFRINPIYPILFTCIISRMEPKALYE